MKLFWAGLLCASISACSRTEVPATTPQVQATATPASAKPPSPDEQMMATLMAAVFGKQFRPATGDALAELADNDDPRKRSSYVITPAAYTVLQNGNTVLVANAETPGEDGKADSSHASRGLLNVFILKRDGATWQVLKRHENIAALGAYGNLGEVKWVELAPQKPGMAITYGDSGQGNSIGFLSLFDLGADTIADLTEGITVASDNDGACVPSTDKCWNVDNKYHFVRAPAGRQYDDLVFEFSGHTAVPKATGNKLTPEELEALDDIERVKIALASTARYAYDGKQYRLVEGSNIVPGI